MPSHAHCVHIMYIQMRFRIMHIGPPPRLWPVGVRIYKHCGSVNENINTYYIHTRTLTHTNTHRHCHVYNNTCYVNSIYRTVCAHLYIYTWPSGCRPFSITTDHARMWLIRYRRHAAAVALFAYPAIADSKTLSGMYNKHFIRPPHDPPLSAHTPTLGLSHINAHNSVPQHTHTHPLTTSSPLGVAL